MKKVVLECKSVDFKTIRPLSRALAVRFFVLLLWRHGVNWECDAIADADNGLGERIIPIGNEINA